jgi:thiol:disulfide interchange protein
MTYPIGMDVAGAVLHTYRVFGIPTRYFIDRNGIIRDRVFGPLDRTGIEERLTEILKP